MRIILWTRLNLISLLIFRSGIHSLWPELEFLLLKSNLNSRCNSRFRHPLKPPSQQVAILLSTNKPNKQKKMTPNKNCGQSTLRFTNKSPNLKNLHPKPPKKPLKRKKYLSKKKMSSKLFPLKMINQTPKPKAAK